MPVPNDEYRQQLIHDIATRAGKASELCAWYDMTKPELEKFVSANIDAIESKAREVAQSEPNYAIEGEVISPTQLSELWITNKFERLKRIQRIADHMYKNWEWDAMTTREFRSYLMLAANELGQLLHRGAGENAAGDTVSYSIEGVDMDNLR